MPRISLDELHTALKLFDTSLTAWASGLSHPESGKSITRTAIYRAIDEKGPQWIVDEITAVILKARKRFPEYYRKRQKQPQ